MVMVVGTCAIMDSMVYCIGCCFNCGLSDYI